MANTSTQNTVLRTKAKSDDGLCLPLDGNYAPYPSAIADLTNAWVGMPVIVHRASAEPNAEYINTWYEVTAVNARNKPSAWKVRESGGSGMTVEQAAQLASLIYFLTQGYSEFSSSNSYSTNDMVVYEGELYFFQQSHSGAWDSTKVSKVTLSWMANKIATSIDYSSLLNKPSIPSKVSDLTNDSGFITSSAISGKADSSDVGSKSNLTTIAKNTLVAAINELDGEMGDVAVSLYNIINGTNYSSQAEIDAASQQV